MQKKGFTLIEVLVTTIVMSMIMGSVLAFVQYAGDIWNKGQDKINTKNYSRMAFELIKEELLTATNVLVPAIGREEESLQFTSSSQYTIKIEDNVLLKQQLPGANSPKTRLARNVKEFKVKRLSKTTFEITLKIQEEREEDVYADDGSSIEPRVISDETMVLIAPGV